ncbi:GAF domain-containing protein [Catenovulum sp. SM1970]|uniref:GAF domain-containing protein n=1 Tax=Marinifaba aquimaris TaxID=2741323 RepID=UPI00157417A4|nr:GAF domain-containing protein [Marinifaba aquimaris]NTS75546.1 GAF domain-containing protein [Marinifaba aquimaris]
MEQYQAQIAELRKKLALETAIISNIEGKTYTIKAIDSAMPVFKVGDAFELKDTYCSAVCDKKQTVVYNNVGKMEEMLLHPVYVMMQLLSYVGTPIRQGDKIWGTLNFSSTEAREQGFSKAEIEAVESLAEAISHSLSNQ